MPVTLRQSHNLTTSYGGYYRSPQLTSSITRARLNLCVSVDVTVSQVLFDGPRRSLTVKSDDSLSRQFLVTTNVSELQCRQTRVTRHTCARLRSHKAARNDPTKGKLLKLAHNSTRSTERSPKRYAGVIDCYIGEDKDKSLRLILGPPCIQDRHIWIWIWMGNFISTATLNFTVISRSLKPVKWRYLNTAQC